MRLTDRRSVPGRVCDPIEALGRTSASTRESVRTPLSDLDVARLRALSVVTVEEFLGLYASAPQAVARFLDVPDVAQLAVDAARNASAQPVAEIQAFRNAAYPFGAEPPPYVSVEELARPTTFETYFDATPVATGGVSVMAIIVDLRSRFGAIRDQGGRETSVAHACCALAEYREGGDVDLSERYLHHLAKRVDGIAEAGTLIQVAMDLLHVRGTCTEATWAYIADAIAGDGSDGPPPAAAADESARHQIPGVLRLPKRSSEAIKDSLDHGVPVALSIPVYENWANNPFAQATGFIPMPLPRTARTGGQAMCAVGYGVGDYPGAGFFILRNSWGTRWAPLSPVEPGYAILPTEYFDAYGWEAYAIRE